MTITIELDSEAEEILNRLRGDMTPSDFFQLLLRMVNSGAVSPPGSGGEPGKSNGP
jgi:hypothetical protein